MARIITKEEAMNYEILSSSLVMSFFRRWFFVFYYKRAARKYKRYIEGMRSFNVNPLAKLPSRQRATEGMKIAIDLEEIKDDNTLAYNIKKAARNEDLPYALRLVTEAAKVNRDAAISICGEELLNRIEKYVNQK